MPYPREQPTNKHDVAGPWPLPSHYTDCPARTMPSHPSYLPSDSSVFAALESRLRMSPHDYKAWAKARSMAVVSNVYTYPDAPTRPKPLSRTLEIVGFVDVSLRLVRTLDALPLSAVSTKCTVGVRRADGEHRRYLEREPRKLKNSEHFATLVSTLRRAGMAAVVGVDSAGRFGVLVPMEDERHGGVGSLDDRGRPEHTSADYAADLYVGKYEDVREALSGDGIVAGPGTPRYERPATPPPANDGTGSPTYQPGTPTYQPGSPTYQPSSPTFKPGTPPDGPPPEDSGGLWKPPGADDDGDGGGGGGGGDGGLWQPPGGGDDDAGDGDGGGGGLWQPPGADDDDTGGGGGGFGGTGDFGSSAFGGGDGANGGGGGMSEWQPSEWDGDANGGAGQKRSHSEMENGSGEQNGDMEAETYHANKGAATADAFYSRLTRTLETRGASKLFHMRNFNGWVKATQIAELDPATKDKKGGRRGTKHPLRILDLACGKGGDLGKWTIHRRGVRNYVGIDVARGSLKDAAIRARRMRQKLRDRCVFTCADLGDDVPGRPRNRGSTNVQKLLSWSLAEESPGESGDPVFKMVTGGGVGPDDTFDVVSIQFAIHYMMQTRERASRFFNTVSELLEVGGNLVFTTIDSRVVLDHMMNLGLDLHFDDDENGNKGEGDDEGEGAVVKVGKGACRLKFDQATVRKIFQKTKKGGRFDPLDPDIFGLEYTFTLVEGDDHDAGFGEAVDLPEWLIPLPTVTALAAQAGMELEYASNFHEFYHERRDPNGHYAAHSALSNMKVLDRNGSISEKEWEISRMYMAVKFRKVRESRMVLEEVSESAAGGGGGGGGFEDVEPEAPAAPPAAPPSAAALLNDPKAKKMLPMAMMKAKQAVGNDVWKSLDGDEKKRRMNEELVKLLS